MSWNVSVRGVVQSDLHNKLKAAVEHDLGPDSHTANDDAKIEARQQAEAAISAAVSLAGVCGDGPHNVTLSGHANPRHTPRDGYANDQVTITVSDARIYERPPTVPVVHESAVPIQEAPAVPAPETPPAKPAG